MSLATGWTVRVNGEAGIITSSASENSGHRIALGVTRADGSPIEEGDTVVVVYDADVGSINAPSEDTDLQDIASFSATNNSTIEIPDYVSSEVDSTGSRVHIVVNRELASASTAGFTIEADNDPVDILDALLDEDGLGLTLIVDAIYDGAVVQIAYDDASGNIVSAASGNELASFAEEATNSSTRVAPTLTSATVQTGGLTILGVFSERVSGTIGTGWSAYNVTRERALTLSPITQTNVPSTGRGVSFTFTEPVYDGDEVTLSYNAGTGDLAAYANPLQEVASFTSAAVANDSALTPVLILVGSCEINTAGTHLTIGLSASTTGTEDLGFTLLVDGEAMAFTSASGLPGTTITAVLDGYVYAGSTVTLAYDSGVGDLVGGSGAEVFDLEAVTITNSSEHQFTPEDMTGIVDYGNVSDLTQFSQTTGGDFGDVSEGDEVRRWKGALETLTYTLTGFYNSEWGKCHLTATGLRGPCYGASAGSFETTHALAYNAAAFLAIGIYYPAGAPRNNGTVRLTASATGSTTIGMNALCVDASGRFELVGLRRGATSVPNKQLSPNTAPAYHVFEIATDGTAAVTATIDGVENSGTAGPSLNSTNATKLVLDLAAYGTSTVVADNTANEATAPRVCAWVVIEGDPTEAELTRFRAWAQAQNPV